MNTACDSAYGPRSAWGPILSGGRPSGLRPWAKVLLALAAGLLVTVGSAAVTLYQVAEGNLKRVHVPALDQRGEDGPLNVLVIGSDSREGLGKQETRELDLGEFSGERSDVILLVSITAGRTDASVLSFPRDLLVTDQETKRKLSGTVTGGPDHVVDVLQETTGVPIHHYVEVSIPGFIGVVDAVDGVRMCLDEPLRDDKSGADFNAGCQYFTPEQALSYVRSRSSQRGDFDRIARQQRFMKALLGRLVATRTLVDLPRLFDLVGQVSRNVTTDAELGLADMRRLAVQLRGLARKDIPMVTVPSYAITVDGLSYVTAYRPGAEAMYDRLAAGLPVGSYGPRSLRRKTRVALWSAGHEPETERVHRTLYWASFPTRRVGHGPGASNGETTVYAAPGKYQRARWVAALLGARIGTLPRGVGLPPGTDVAVRVADRPDIGSATTAQATPETGGQPSESAPPLPARTSPDRRRGTP